MPTSKLKIAAVLAALICAAPGLVHAETCYDAAAAEADSVLRYQAWLRVIGLSCTGAGGSLYVQYQAFAEKNQPILQGAGETLQHFYKAHYKGDPESRLHARESEASNEEALAATRGGNLAFCGAHAGDLKRAASDGPDEIKREIAGFDAAHPASKRKCSK